MTCTPLRLKRAWIQEVKDGFLVKGATESGKQYYLRRCVGDKFRFVPERHLGTTYIGATAEQHVSALNRSIAKGTENVSLMTDNRVKAGRMFVMLINGNQYGGIFDRAEKAEEAVNAYNALHGKGAARYVDVSKEINKGA